MWGRLADSRDDLPDANFLTVGDPNETPLRVGPALLPTWLQASVDRQALPDDGTGIGRRQFRATIPAAELLLTLDATGDPVHAEVTNGPDGPNLRLVLDLTRLGDPVDIPLPTEPQP